MMKINTLFIVNFFLFLLITSNLTFAESPPMQERVNEKQNSAKTSLEKSVSKEENQNEKNLPPKTEKQKTEKRNLNHNVGKSSDNIRPRINLNSPPGVNN